MHTIENLLIYEQPGVVLQYLRYRQLTRGEALILRRHKNLFAGKSLLDVGVGTGRTTPALARLAAKYVGIDYSSAMVACCREQFSAHKELSFFKEDARTLLRFEDKEFDTLFFSFNGIDTVDADARKQVLRAVRRVLRPGGAFVFSFHNSLYLPQLFRPHWSRNPLNWADNYRYYKRLLSVNKSKAEFAGLNFFQIRDGGEDFKLEVMYTAPAYQAAMLQQEGFRLIGCIESQSGKEIGIQSLQRTSAPWLYFICIREA